MPEEAVEQVTRGYVKIPRERSSSWLPMLKSLYKFESDRVSGPGSERRFLDGVIWSREEAMERIALARQFPDDFDTLLSFLLEERQAMEFPGEGDSRYITRVGELVRRLGHTYEFWYRGRPTVAATRWLVENKSIPCRDIPSMDFRDEVVAKLDKWCPGGPGHNLRQAAKEVCEAVAKAIAKGFGGDWVEDVLFSDFQLKSTLEILESRYGPESGKKAQVLTAGVGSGKTIGFSIAALIEARRSMLDAEGAARGGSENANDFQTTCLFVYPRTQLARDQYQEISKFAKEMESPGMEPFLELYETYKLRGGMGSTTQGVVDEYGEGAGAKPIILTTYETLKRRMRRPEFMNKMAGHLRTVVLDEIHLTSGIPGGMASYLLSRLKAAAQSKGGKIYWIGASATIARPDLHAATLFGINREEVGVVDPSEEEMVQDGINHHIFLRPNRGMSTMGTLVNTTSILLHERRDDLETDREGGDEDRPKAIGFADGLDLLGRWNDDLRQNERTEEEFGKYGRKHPNSEDISTWDRKQRELPYAMRFHNPLQRRLVSKGGDDKKNLGDALENLSGLFDKAAASTVCDKCRKGERVVLGEISPDHLKELSKLVHRHPHKEDDLFKAFRVESEVFESEDPLLIGSHELCPMMKAGACSWFPRPDIERTSVIREPISGHPDYARYDFSSSARSTVESAKRDRVEDLPGSNLSSRIFTESKNVVFDIRGREGSERVPVDIVLSSPTLEVGVDIPMLTESMMHKAIRNIASYRQKAGRVGRDSNLDIVNVSVMTQSAVDLHYYRQPRKLISEGRLEPIPLMENNRAIKACSAYGAIWEWLALNASIPEWIQIPRGNPCEMSISLEACKNELDSRRADVIDYIHKATKGRLETDSRGREIAHEALKQVIAEINLLLLPATSSYKMSPDPGRVYSVVDLFSNHKKQMNNGPMTIRMSNDVSVNLLEEVKDLENEIEKGIKDIHAENLVGERKELFDIIMEIRIKKDWQDLSADYCKETRREVMRLVEDNDDLEDASYTLIRALRKLGKALAKIEESGFDMKVKSLFEDYKKIQGSDASFLSSTLDHLKLIGNQRRDTWFIRPQTLFENPYSPEVKLSIETLGEGSPNPLNESQKVVRLHEALHSFQPGTWTHRIPHRKLKVRTGNLKKEGSRVIATLRNMTAANNKFALVHEESLPPPPGSNESVRVWRPTELSLVESHNKYVRLDKRSSMIRDGDEMDVRGGGEENPDDIEEMEGGSTKDVKIPKSFANRWVWSEPGEGELMGAFDATRFSGHKYGLETDEGNEISIDGNELKHPLVEGLMDSIKWHDNLSVIEYTYTSSRSYSSAGEVEVSYQDDYDRAVAFGEKITTEGFSFSLNKEHVDSIRDSVLQEMIDGSKEVTPSLIKSFKAHIFTDIENNGSSVNPYTLDDLVSVLLIHSNWDGEGISAENWCERILNAISDSSGFHLVALDYYKRMMKMKRESSDEDEDQGGEGEDAMAESRVSSLRETLRVVEGSISGFEEGLGLWVHRTILSTFGSVAMSSLMRFSGSNSNDIGYLIDPSSWGGTDYRVTLYDKAHFGNGSCRTAKEYLHIPHVLRYSGNLERAKLPSTDFLSCFEEGLLQCMQQQTDVGSLAIHADGGQTDGVAGIPDLIAHCKEGFEVGGETWDKIGVTGPSDAWGLPLRKRMALHYEATIDELHGDDVVRACTTCWNGCPECVDDISTALGGLRGLDFVDKLMLDRWFLSSIEDSDSYEIHRLRDIGNGDAEMHLGSLNSLRLTNSSGFKIHSVCLPWTMGFVTSRHDSSPPRLILRDSDVSGMRVGGTQGTAMGIPSHGFRRLLWFNLLLTGHLDSVGAIEDEDKSIKLLYYDARDISFSDVGISPRMLDSMSAVSNVGELEKLSDVLNWMLERGFKVEICIDRQQASQGGVMDFLTSLNQSELLTIKSMPPGFQGNMHKKDLITPIAVMTGTANISNNGVSRSQETISHTMRYNTTQYESMRRTSNLAFENAQEIDLSSITPPEYRGNGARSGAVIAPLSPIDEIANKMESGDMGNEDLQLEYKPFFTKVSETIPNGTWKDTVDIVFKEIASMLNTDGGFVVVGVEDPMNNPNSEEFTVIGIDDEIEEHGGLDPFMVKTTTWMKNVFGLGVSSSLLRSEIRDINGKSLLIFHVEPCKEFIAYLKPLGGAMKIKHQRNGYGNDGAIYVRSNDSGMILEAGAIINWHSLRFSN